MAQENNMTSPLQLYRTKWFAGLVDENNLSNALMTRPHEISPVVSYLMGYFNQGNVIDYLTNGIGKTTVIENHEYEWNVMIEHDKAITILDAKWQGNTISSSDLPGISQTPIQLWLAEKWFGPGAIISFDDNEYQARIIGEPYQDGNAFVYTVVAAEGKNDSYIDPSLLTSGKQVSRIGSAYEEYSEEADIFNYNTPFKLRNHLTTMRASYDITGSAYSSVMVVAMKDGKSGKSSYYWADYQEWVAIRQWHERIDMMTIYSRYNKASDGTVSLKGTNGRPVYIGAGLLQQIAPANKKSYTTLTLDILDNFMSDLSYNLRGFGDRNFLGFGGEMAMRELDRVLREKASGYTLIDSKFVSGSGQELTLGGQFTTYKGLNGVTLTLKHLPILDNTTYNRKLHPVSGKPLESYTMIFLDNSTKDGQSNLRKVVRKGREMVMWYLGGSVAPGAGYGKSISTLRSNAKDGYSVQFLSEQGIMLADPTTSGILYCDAE